MRFCLKVSLRSLVVVGALFAATAQVQADDVVEDISPDTLQTSEKFGWGDLNPVNWGKDIEHDAEKLGKGIAKAGEKAWTVLKSLAEPCNACKTAVGMGIDSFVCGQPASAMAKQVSECTVKVAEGEPVLAEESPVLCTAIKAAVEIACKRIIKHNEKLDKIRSSLIDHTCHEAHLCK